MTKNRIKLGWKVKDVVTGFTGIAICRTKFLTGCVQIGILPQSEDPTKYPDSNHIDESRLIKIDDGVLEYTQTIVDEETKSPGGENIKVAL